MIISIETQKFITLHANDDIRQLALRTDRAKAEGAGIDLTFALEQIAGRQTARHKLPSWAGKDGIIFPPHISMEQCSSEQTARYKARVMKEYSSLSNLTHCGDDSKVDATLIDMTGGFGVDFSFLAQGFAHSIYVERQEHLCDIARHNMPLLGLSDAKVVCGDGTEHINGENIAVFIDPARRDNAGNRTYAIGDCTPDIIGFIDELLMKAFVVMIKLSPMLDWHATVNDINNAVEGHDAVREIHIISTANECKELLVVASTRSRMPLKVVCVNDEQVVSFTDDDDETSLPYASPTAGNWLYVPNASIMKAGCFNAVSNKFGLCMVSANSHLFTGNALMDDFPGRCFRIKDVAGMGKKALKEVLKGVTQANISTRNFPLSPEQLRKRLKLRDGGNTYIFATTTDNNEHILAITEKQDKKNATIRI